MHDIDQPVVVDGGKDEHRDQATDQPEDLLGLKTDKLGVQRGAIDFKNADGGKQQDHAQEQPVEITE